MYIILRIQLKKEKKNKKKFDFSNFKDGINETIILSTAIAGLLTWFIASKYLNDADNHTDNDIDNSILNKEMIFNELNTDNRSSVIVQNKEMNIPKKISMKNDMQTNSINLINSGVNVPINEIKLPNVLIDYN